MIAFPASQLFLCNIGVILKPIDAHGILHHSVICGGPGIGGDCVYDPTRRHPPEPAHQHLFGGRHVLAQRCRRYRIGYGIAKPVMDQIEFNYEIPFG